MKRFGPHSMTIWPLKYTKGSFFPICINFYKYADIRQIIMACFYEKKNSL